MKWRSSIFNITLPETNIAHENPIFPGKYHQNCGFSMAMLVSGSVKAKAFKIANHDSMKKCNDFKPRAPSKDF